MDINLGNSRGDHLIVLVHGIIGRPRHMEYLSNGLCERFPNANIFVPNIVHTYAGIAFCAKQVCDKIIALTKSYMPHTISIIGNSLGGLIAKYCIGLLHEQRFFEHVKPIVFCTIATPHLGIRKKNLLQIANIFGKTFRELSLHDSYGPDNVPNIAHMMIPGTVFVEALAQFRVRYCLGNVRNDRLVPPYSSLVLTNFSNCNLQGIADAVNTVVPQETTVVSPLELSEASTYIRQFHELRTKNQSVTNNNLMEKMVTCFHAHKWIKVYCYLHGINTHRAVTQSRRDSPSLLWLLDILIATITQ